MFKSVTAVLLGVFVTFVIEALLVFGIMGPVFEVFLPQNVMTGAVWAAILLVFPVAFAFYFGGMAAGYRAPSRNTLHGLAVVVILFVASPLLNLLALSGQDDPLPQLRAVQTIVIFAVAVVAAFTGARRGKMIFDHNQAHLRRQRSRQESRQQGR